MYNLMQEFEKRFSPLLREGEELKDKLAVLTSDTSFELTLRQLRAKAGVIDGEILRLTSEAQFGEVEKKETEKREIEGRIHKVTSERNQKIDGLEERISSLASEKKNVADEVLKEGFASIQKEAWSCLEETIDSIDSAWKEIEKFQRETGATAAGVGVHNLKIYPNSNRRELWEKVSRWVHVPVQV